MPVPGPDKVGDIVPYCRQASRGESGIQWSVGSRIVGFETNPVEPDKAPHTCWVICDGLPVCVGTDKLRACTAAELLAYQYIAAQKTEMSPVAETQRQQDFIDARDEVAVVSVPGPQEMMLESELEVRDEASRVRIEEPNYDELMSSEDEEPFQRKELRADPSSSSGSVPALGDKRKELRASAEPVIEEVAEGNSSLQQAWKKTKTSGKGVAILERLSHHLANEEGDFEKTGFIQVRLVGPRAKKQTKKPVRPKDGEKNLRYADCTPEIQKGLRQCRAEEWQKWMKFNAGVVVSQQEVDLLMSEGVKILPMQWVETDKNAHKRRHNVKVPPLLKSRLVGCGNFEDTEGLRTDSPTADVDAHNLVFSWTASSKVKIGVRTSRAPISKGKRWIA